MRWPAVLVPPVLACAFRCLARMHCHHTCCFRPLAEVETPGVLHSIMLATWAQQWAQPMYQCQNQCVLCVAWHHCSPQARLSATRAFGTLARACARTHPARGRALISAAEKAECKHMLVRMYRKRGRRRELDRLTGRVSSFGFRLTSAADKAESATSALSTSASISKSGGLLP